MKNILSSASALDWHTLSSLTKNLIARSICWDLTSSCISSPTKASERLWTMKMLGLDSLSDTLWKNFWKRKFKKFRDIMTFCNLHIKRLQDFCSPLVSLSKVWQIHDVWKKSLNEESLKMNAAISLKKSSCISFPTKASERLWTMKMLGLESFSDTLWKYFWWRKFEKVRDIINFFCNLKLCQNKKEDETHLSNMQLKEYRLIFVTKVKIFKIFFFCFVTEEILSITAILYRVDQQCCQGWNRPVPSVGSPDFWLNHR